MSSNSKIHKRISELVTLINKYNQAYYVDNQSLISDQEYDQLFHELKALEEQYPDAKHSDSPTARVGNDQTSTFTKARHLVPMLSLANVFDERELRKFYRRFTPYYQEMGKEAIDQFYCDVKMDGVALELIYKEGHLAKAITRGNGREGDDVTANAMVITNIPKRINTPKTLSVRGEIVVHRADFNNINSDNERKGKQVFSNPRNYASGSLKQKDPEITRTRALRFYAYDYNRGLSDAERSSSANKHHEAKINDLRLLGFNVPQGRLCISFFEVMEYIGSLNGGRQKLAYDIDGVVIKQNNPHVAAKVGVNNHHPLWATAWKFVSLGMTTTIKQINWGLGRTGKLTPVANIQPVSIGGATISEVTLNNVAYVENNQIGVDAKISVIRSGDVIPKIQNILSSGKYDNGAHIPKQCPYCQQEVSRIGTDLRCTNLDCPEIFATQLIYLVSKDVLNIQGVGEQFVRQLIDSKSITSLIDLFGYIEMKTGGSNQELADRITSRMQKINLMELLMIVGIPAMGRAVANKTSIEVEDFTGFLKYLNHPEQMVNLQLNESTKNNLNQWYSFDKHKRLLENISKLQLINLS